MFALGIVLLGQQATDFDAKKALGVEPPVLAKMMKGPDAVQSSGAWYKINDSTCVWVEFEDGKSAGLGFEFFDAKISWQQALRTVGLSAAGAKAKTIGRDLFLIEGVRGVPAGWSVRFNSAHEGNWENSAQLSIFRKGREDMIRIEAERLNWTMKGGVMVPCDQVLSGSTVVLWEEAAAGDTASFTIPISRPGSYEVFLQAGFDQNMGGVKVSSAAKTQTLNFRTLTAVWKDVSCGVVRLDQPGEIKVDLTAVGNRSEDVFSYHLALDWVKVERRVTD